MEKKSIKYKISLFKTFRREITKSSNRGMFKIIHIQIIFLPISILSFDIHLWNRSFPINKRHWNNFNNSKHAMKVTNFHFRFL